MAKKTTLKPVKAVAKAVATVTRAAKKGTAKLTAAKKGTSNVAAAAKKPAARAKKHVFFFGNGKADGDRTMRDTLGGKGAGLSEMTNAGLPVPPGFTISTDVCSVFYDNNGKLSPEIQAQIDEALGRLEGVSEQKLGSTEHPLLVSVRSGAKFSMPGMMDTILNLGLNETTVKALSSRTGNDRFAWDSYRRFIQMYGNVVL